MTWRTPSKEHNNEADVILQSTGSSYYISGLEAAIFLDNLTFPDGADPYSLQNISVTDLKLYETPISVQRTCDREKREYANNGEISLSNLEILVLGTRHTASIGTQDCLETIQDEEGVDTVSIVLGTMAGVAALFAVGTAIGAFIIHHRHKISSTNIHQDVERIPRIMSLAT